MSGPLQAIENPIARTRLHGHPRAFNFPCALYDMPLPLQAAPLMLSVQQYCAADLRPHPACIQPPAALCDNVSEQQSIVPDPITVQLPRRLHPPHRPHLEVLNF